MTSLPARFRHRRSTDKLWDVVSCIQVSKLLLILGLVAPLGMLVLTVTMLLSMRQAAWDSADQASNQLLQVLEHDISHDIESYDLSVQGVIEGLTTPNIDKLDAVTRRRLLFDHAATATDRGLMLVLDEHGDATDELTDSPFRPINDADREYFRIQKANPTVGLFISKPFVSRLSGVPVIALSRRFNKPDGSFGGIVVGTIKLTYFTHLFERADLGPNDAINLFRTDGTRVARYPFVDADIGSSIASSPSFARLRDEERGNLTAISSRDQVNRHYSFAHLGSLPLILDVALAAEGVESRWRVEAIVIMAASLLLCGGTVGSMLWAKYEFERRTRLEAELDGMLHTDALTGVANRRRFDSVFPAKCAHAQSTGRPLSLLIIDADHFKSINDRLGHQTGDEVLKALAQCLTLAVHRKLDLVCRMGGEEFGVLLPDTDGHGACQVASKVHKQLADWRPWPPGIEAGTVTVSIGIASLQDACSFGQEELYRNADKALYQAKADGRNRSCVAAPARSRTLSGLAA